MILVFHQKYFLIESKYFVNIGISSLGKYFLLNSNSSVILIFEYTYFAQNQLCFTNIGVSLKISAAFSHNSLILDKQQKAILASMFPKCQLSITGYILCKTSKTLGQYWLTSEKIARTKQLKQEKEVYYSDRYTASVIFLIFFFIEYQSVDGC